MSKIYIDGAWYDKDQAKVSVFDHGLLYGDGVFEGIRIYNGRIFRLHEHVERLFDSAKAIDLKVPHPAEELEKIILQTVKQAKLREGYVRVLLTRGFGDLGLDMRKCKKPTLIVIADKIELYPETVYEAGIRLATVSLRRMPNDCLSPSIKSLNYLNNILARAEAARCGAQEAILLNKEGYVAECSGDNIFYLKGGQFFTPLVSAGALAGITRACAMEIVKTQLRHPMLETLFTVNDLYKAEEVFLTGTGAEIIGVIEIDGKKIGNGKPGKWTREIQKLYRKMAQTTGVPIDEPASSAV